MEAWIGVVGIVVGAVLGWLARVWQTKQEWSREDAKRWTDDRRRVYAEMMAAIDEMKGFLGTVEGMRREIPLPGGTRYLNDDELSDFFNTTLSRMNEVRRDIELISSDQVVAACNEVWRLSAMCEVGRSQHPRLMNELDAAKAALRLAMRSELGVVK